jgi:hypothetical protein
MTAFDIAQFPEYRQIPLSRGLFAIVDAENYEWLMQWKWYAIPSPYTVYVARSSSRIGGKRRTISMHVQVMNTPKGMETDHQNSNGLMNTYDNLRVCTKAQNMQSRRPKRNTYSKFKGVTWDKKCNKWVAQLRKDGKRIFLGGFSSEIEAARAYNEAAPRYFGEFAKLNRIPYEKTA